MNSPQIPERRDFLSGAVGLGLLSLTGCGGGGGGNSMTSAGNMGGTGSQPVAASSGMAFHLPATLFGNTITAAAGSYDLGTGPQSGALLFNGQWPSPLIRIVADDTLDMTLQNRLSESTNIHWHGLAAAAGMDGHPTEVNAAGANKRYTFAVNERPGTYWYHPHPDGATARQAYSGLAGMLIVDDGNDAARGLPTGIRDIPLVLADKRLSNGALIYQPNQMDIMTGWLGNAITVNGTLGAVSVSVEPAVIRLRLLNASNARILNPALANGRSFWLIGTDGGLLPAPVAVTSLLLAPGERAEILLDLRNDAGQTIKFISAGFALNSRNMMGNAPPQGTAFDALNFVVSSIAANPGSIPVSFSPIIRHDAAAAIVNRTFVLTEMGGMMNGMHRINNLVYAGARIDFVARRGDLERWQFINTGAEPHPMHVHGSQFQVVSRDGVETKRLPTDLGWKDTVLVRALETVEIALRFSTVGNYVLHCHNLEHEDDGMMLNFNVV
jgi:FtsP/CotA-like multicopper oxidase with cupredoxin domain